MKNKLISVVGVNPPSDIAFGSIAEVRRRNMSCRRMTRTSQQECWGILEYDTTQWSSQRMREDGTISIAMANSMQFADIFDDVRHSPIHMQEKIS